MTDPYIVRHRNPAVGYLWYADMVDTDGEHHRLALFLFGLVPRPTDPRKKKKGFADPEKPSYARTKHNVLVHSSRVVDNQELGKAECTHWPHTKTYKMQQATAIAHFLLRHDKVLGVSLFGSLARGENGADYDMVIRTCPSLAWKNLHRAHEQGRGVSVLISHHRINENLIWLLDLDQDQQNELKELINGMKLDLQVLPQPMNTTFRRHFMSGAQRTGRDSSYEQDFLTTIEADFVRFDPSTGTFRAKKAAL
jgi:hypothetical protein